jgi:hypothetical protein
MLLQIRIQIISAIRSILWYDSKKMEVKNITFADDFSIQSIILPPIILRVVFSSITGEHST